MPPKVCLDAAPSATAYPDSDKVGVWTGIKPENLIVERSSGVDYYRGEKP
jgi:hypothetical protein